MLNLLCSLLRDRLLIQPTSESAAVLSLEPVDPSASIAAVADPSDFLPFTAG